MAEAQVSMAPPISRPLPEMIKDAAMVAGVATALAIPMVGLQTVETQSGTVLNFRFGQMMYAVAVIFLGRLGFSLVDAGRGHQPTHIATALSLGWLAAWYWVSSEITYPVLGWLTFLVAASLSLRGWYVWGHGRFAVDRDRAQGAVDWVTRITRWLGPLLLAYAVLLPVLHYDQRSVGLGVQVLIYVMLGWGLNVVVGLAGLLDLGYVAFYAVGAYTYGLLSTKLGLGFWETLPMAGVLAATFGVLLGFPVLRLRGDYLAIVTLGFGEIVRIVLLNWNELSNGPQGVGDIPRPDFFGMPFAPAAPEGITTFHQYFNLDFSPLHRAVYFYYIILFLALLTNWFTLRIRKLPISRAWEALREDETACRALGINPTNTKLTAFAIGAMFAGFAGSFFAARQGYITPTSFSFIESAIILAIVVLGGMGSQVGVVIASIILIGGPEWFRELESFRMLGFGGLMVAIMIWRPQGLLSHREPTIRLHAGGPPNTGSGG